MVTKYEQLVPVIFGTGAVATLGSETAKLGCRKVICIYDSGVAASGISEKATASLKAAGVDYITFGKIQSDPADYIVNECAALAHSENVDGVIGIGGGSSMDCAKAVTVLMNHQLPIEQYFTAPPSYFESSVPLILVPTTAGTGSECTLAAVITESRSGAKLAILLRASLAVVDPELTYSTPPSVTANSGFDAFCHAAEAITSNNGNPYSELLGIAAIEKIVRFLPDALKSGTDEQARFQLSLASNWAGIAFADASCHLGHSLGDALSADFHTPHGYNCIIVEGEALAACAKAVPNKVRLIGKAMGLTFSGNETPEQIGIMTAERIRSLMRECGIRSAEAAGFPRDKFIASAQTCMALNLFFMRYSPVEVTAELAADILTKSYENYK